MYIETTVWGMLVPGQPAEMRRVSARFISRLTPGEGHLSKVVLEEIDAARVAVRRKLFKEIARAAPNLLEVTSESEELAQAYLDAGILPKKKRNDALHVAIATVHSMEVLVSWNYRHLANLEKNARYREVNYSEGYEQTPLILTPYEVLND